jgi:diacylglycerol kinase family enzyme
LISERPQTTVAAPAGRPARTQLLLLVNPRASRADADLLAVAARVLHGGFDVSTVYTEERGHAAALAREAAQEGFAVVAAAGGDGTFSEAADGLTGTDSAMACLPFGCTNVFARAIGTPRHPVTAAERLVARHSDGLLEARLVDVGTVNGRPFLCTAGIGFSASMTATAEAVPSRKATFGQLHFAAAGASELARRYLRNPPRMRVEAGGRSAEGVTMMAQNTRALTYFGPREIRACAASGLHTGAISLTLLHRAKPRDIPPVVARLVAGHVSSHRHVESFPSVRTGTVTAVDGQPLPFEADGEYLGESSRIELGVRPAALRVVV